jgi:hypothetical protein
MQFVYKPEGADPITWDFDPTRLMSPEVETIERHTGLTFMQWVEGVGNGSFLAFHGLLYVLLKRTSPTLKWTDVQFCMADIDMVMSAEEEDDLIARLTAKRDAEGLDSTEEAYLAQVEAKRAATEEPDAPLGDED